MLLYYFLTIAIPLFNVVVEPYISNYLTTNVQEQFAAALIEVGLPAEEALKPMFKPKNYVPNPLSNGMMVEYIEPFIDENKPLWEHDLNEKSELFIQLYNESSEFRENYDKFKAYRQAREKAWSMVQTPPLARYVIVGVHVVAIYCSTQDIVLSIFIPAAINFILVAL